MRVKMIVDEDFVQYKEASMFIGTCRCNWKCCAEAGVLSTVCQNHIWATEPDHNIDDNRIVDRYIGNPYTTAVVFGGLEPMDQFEELHALILAFRQRTNDTIVIYTGYNPEEIEEKLVRLLDIPNIVVKFGRYVPNQYSVKDPVLGVDLASPNQFAMKIS